MEKTERKSQTIVRWTLYCIGMVVLSLGIILNTKSCFGVTPIISTAYTASLIWKLNFGNACLVLYVILAAVEYILKGKNFKLYDLLQIPLAALMTRFFNIFAEYLPDASSIPGRIVCLAMGITFTGLGAAMMVNCRLVPNPGDGIVQALADRIGKTMGFTKNCFDIGCVALAAAMGLFAEGQLVGLGVGTIAAMIGVGRVIALYNYLFQEKTTKAMGLEYRPVQRRQRVRAGESGAEILSAERE